MNTLLSSLAQQTERRAAAIALAVDDSGAGIGAEERAKVMGRCYRAGDTNSPGAGLGLFIVDTIAQIHDAEVELGESDLGGLRVTVRFKIS